ncbi:sigma-70 family RNA polymerase sigma factor [Rothia nasimurium]|uniref:Sigma-70 family RNA polymerase sigma factor n=1 Tax=Rothia nasimurium TaxID=85336 RepID=A0A4Y9F7N2_9MICC|nr:sigma factor [Rothia nasimurium]MBF0807640.1 sigma-70 family RNA polymerase sigma factor [Rothia nasimurium]TFU23376.1 sigma-70 family RNA polymerase sigma factor [Rothia nasimurium]
MQTTTSTFWTPERLETWESTSTVIYKVLSKFPHIHDLPGAIEDTHQDAFLVAHQGLHTFDEAQGDFGAWIRSIAVRCAYAHLRNLKSDDRTQAEATVDAALTGLTSDSALETLLALTHMEEKLQDLAAVLGIAIKALGDIEPITRVLNLILAEEPLSYRSTAEVLGIAEKTLYKSSAKVLMYTEVIYRALLIHRYRQDAGLEEAPVLMREVISCLPRSSLTTAPHFTHRIVQATLEAGHVENIDLEALQESTGWSESYARRCICTTSKLFNLALAVIQQGDI